MKTSPFIKVFFVLLLLLVGLFGSTGCENRRTSNRSDSLFLVTDQGNVLYDLKNPSQKFFLPYVLEEISGLGFHPNGNILAIDDETGKVFEYNLTKRKIVHSIKFHAPDDFEGVEMVGDTIYVLRSDGDLYYFPYTKEKQIQSTKVETKLSSKNDTEGLGFNPASGNLLIACKEKAGIEQGLKGRAIYEYDPRTRKIDEDPFALLSPKKLLLFWETRRNTTYDKERIKFKPSGIALNPVDQNFYVIASIGKLMVALNREGHVEATYPLYPSIMGQPEGICFNANGDLFVSSEGEGDRGYILKFPLSK